MAEEQTATLEAEDGKPVDTQPLQDDAQQQSGDGEQSQDKAIDENAAETQDARSDWERAVELEKLCEDPNHRKFSDKEYELLEDYLKGNVKQPAEKATAESKSEENKEPEAAQEKEKSEEQSQEVDKETFDSSSSLDLAIMQELGAKKKTEVLNKIKGLRKAVSGKLDAAPEYKKVKEDADVLRQIVSSNRALMGDLMKGESKAVQYLKQHYGLTVVKDNQAKSTDSTDDNNSDSGLISSDKFIDEEAATEVNRVISRLQAKVDAIEKNQTEYQRSINQQRETMAERQAAAETIDQMVRVAEHIPGLKNTPNLREIIINWKEKGIEDSRLDFFNDIFNIATDEGVNLLQAHLIDKGRKADFVIKKAKDDGIKEAYNQTPNKTLSDIQGRNISTPEDYSDAEVNKMVEEHRLPESWFDENDQPNFRTIPKKHWKHFG